MGPSLHDRYSLHRYYNPLTSLSSSRFPRLYACPPILPLGKSDKEIPRSLSDLQDMPCSPTPGMLIGTARVSFQPVLSSTVLRVSTIPKSAISRLNRFNLSAYGLPFSLSTLDPCRCRHEPKTRSGVRWAPLPREDSHLQSLSASWRTKTRRR